MPSSCCSLSFAHVRKHCILGLFVPGMFAFVHLCTTALSSRLSSLGPRAVGPISLVSARRRDRPIFRLG
jgi:hypothetical protein